MLLQPDGKIVVGGTSLLTTENPPPAQAILERYNPDGTLDAGFGKGGKVLLSVPGSRITALALQTDGKLLTNVGKPFVRVLPNGIIDPSQAPGIIALTAHTGPGTFQPDGRFVLTGSVPDGPSGELDGQTVRFTGDGAMDPSFVSPVFDFGKQTQLGNDSSAAIALQTDGKVLVGGSSHFEFGLTRLRIDGSLDFGLRHFRRGGHPVQHETHLRSFGDVARRAAGRQDYGYKQRLYDPERRSGDRAGPLSALTGALRIFAACSNNGNQDLSRTLGRD